MRNLLWAFVLLSATIQAEPVIEAVYVGHQPDSNSNCFGMRLKNKTWS